MWPGWVHWSGEALHGKPTCLPGIVLSTPDWYADVTVHVPPSVTELIHRERAAMLQLRNEERKKQVRPRWRP